MVYTGPIIMTGDQVATFSGSPTNDGNLGDPDFSMVMQDVTALGEPEDIFRLVWFQNVNSTDTIFKNGQGWRLQQYTGSGDPTIDQNNWSNVPGVGNLNPGNDLVSGVGGGDEYIVFTRGSNSLLYNINGGLSTTPTTLVYRADEQNGNLSLGNNNSELDFGDAAAAFNVVCFCAGTLIETDQGQIAVEDLAVGDLVHTLDSGIQPIRWIGRSDVSIGGTKVNPGILPVKVDAGAMGDNIPVRDVWLSPQHRVLVRSKIVERMTGNAEALVAVKQLCSTLGISQCTKPQNVTYFHLRLDRHELVRAEGMWAETLLVGAQALLGMTPAARRELQILFPDLIEDAADAARTVVSGKSGRTLAERHIKNFKKLVVNPD